MNALPAEVNLSARYMNSEITGLDRNRATFWWYNPTAAQWGRPRSSSSTRPSTSSAPRRPASAPTASACPDHQSVPVATDRGWLTVLRCPHGPDTVVPGADARQSLLEVWNLIDNVIRPRSRDRPPVPLSKRHPRGPAGVRPAEVTDAPARSQRPVQLALRRRIVCCLGDAVEQQRPQRPGPPDPVGAEHDRPLFLQSRQARHECLLGALVALLAGEQQPVGVADRRPAGHAAAGHAARWPSYRPSTLPALDLPPIQAPPIDLPAIDPPAVDLPGGRPSSRRPAAGQPVLDPASGCRAASSGDPRGPGARRRGASRASIRSGTADPPDWRTPRNPLGTGQRSRRCQPHERERRRR